MGTIAFCSSSQNRKPETSARVSFVENDIKRQPDLIKQPTHRKLQSTLDLGEDPNDYEGVDRHRVILVHELVNSEKIYLRGLQRIFIDFVDPLEDKQILPSNSDLRRFLAPIEMLCEKHTIFYFEMSQSNNIASVFQPETISFLKTYAMFITQYENIMQQILDLRKRNPQVDVFFNEKEHDIEFYLLYPIQRIPRYQMLIKRLLEYTPSDHPEHEILAKAAKGIEDVCEELNETKRKAENFSELKKLRQRIKNFEEPLWGPNREFISEFKCRLPVKGLLFGYSVKPGLFYVFTDMLVVCNGSCEYIRHTFFSYFRKIEQHQISSNYKFCIKISFVFDLEEELILVAGSQEEAQNWYEIFYKRKEENGIKSYIRSTSDYNDDFSSSSL